MTLQQKINALSHLKEYSDYFYNNIEDDEKYRLRKDTVSLLAKVFFPNEQFDPPFNEAFFQRVSSLAQTEIDFLSDPNTPPSLPTSNIPDNLAELLKNLQEYKTNQRDLNRLQITSYNDWAKNRTAELEKKVREYTRQSEEQLAEKVYSSLPSDLLADMLADKGISKDLAAKIIDRTARLQVEPPEKRAAEAVDEWEKALSFSIPQVDKKEIIKTAAEQPVIEDVALFNQILAERKKIQDYVYDERLQATLLEQTVVQSKGRLSYDEAYIELQEDIITQQRAYRNFLRETLNSQLSATIDKALGSAIQNLGPNTEEAKILKEESPQIKTNVARMLASPKFGRQLKTNPNATEIIIEQVMRQTEATVIIKPHWFHRPQVNRAVTELKQVLTEDLKKSSKLTIIAQEIQEENTTYSLIPTGDPEHAMGIAYGGLLSFILNPELNKTTDTIFDFLNHINKETLIEFGSLPFELKLLFYKSRPEDLEGLCREEERQGRLTREQVNKLFHFSEKFKEFSEKHKIFGFLTRTIATYKYKKASSLGFSALTSILSPGFLKNLAYHPDMVGVIGYEYTKSIGIAIVKDRLIRPAANKFAVKIGTHLVDPITNNLRFKPTYYVEKAISKLFKKVIKFIADKLGPRVVGFLASLAIPIAGWATGAFSIAMVLWDLFGGLIKQAFKAAIFALGLFIYWLSQYGIGALISAGLGAIIGAAIGLSIGGPIGLVIGFFVGSVVGGLVGVLLTKIAGALGGALFGSSAASALTATISAAAPVAGVTLTVMGTTAGILFGGQILFHSFILSSFNPFRIMDTNTGTMQASGELKNLFQKAADKACIPVASLMAISQLEASGTWNYSPEEINTFSTSGWWTNASQSQLERGYCTDTCQKPGVNCAKIDWEKNMYCSQIDTTNPGFTCTETSVYGPMQFEALTWAGKFGKENLMERCNLVKSIDSAAEKIKSAAGAGSSCTSWDEKTMKNAAKGYCGSCGTSSCQEGDSSCKMASSPCGKDYCGTAWSLYQGYKL